ncbi:MAG: AraC family transcriptional regulator [Planctomycetota bacterium]|nr:AraC family transcriptional regulator [Planctomycetota bacterium]
MRESTRRDYAERLTRVLVHIQGNLDRDLSLEALAGVASFSPFHFHRIFRGLLGESVKEHVRRLRLERAALRLRNTDRSVVDIAFEAGYESHEAFSRAFKGMSGESPSSFRARRRSVPLPPVPSGVHFRPDGDLSSEEIDWPATGQPSMQVTVKPLTPMRVAFLRHVGPYSQCGETWDELLPRLGAAGWLGAGTTFLGLCHDDPEVTPSGKLRYDACVTVGDEFEPDGDVGAQTVTGGDYAVATHSGPYDDLGNTYASLFGQWMPASGREPRSAPCLEVYLNDPGSTEPEDLLTEVHVPLEGRRRS